jgi:hypothetical protein
MPDGTPHLSRRTVSEGERSAVDSRLTADGQKVPVPVD